MIDQQLQSSLRKRYNPEGSPLRAHQMRMLKILSYIDTVCRQNDIRYWLSSGTLIGAMRHGGFIPWDDDIDVEMLDADYRRLIAILSRDSGQYILQHTATDSGFLFPFAKLRDPNSKIEEADGLDAGQRYSGVYVDIFRMQPSNSRHIHHLASRALGTELKFRSRHPRQRVAAALLRFVLHGIAFPVMNFVDSLGQSQRQRHAIPSYFLAPRYVGDLFPLVEVEFEGRKFFAPRDTDTYLRRLYGDYMAIPDADHIQIHTSKVTLW
jgi:lipopolysaccharide cholinephosphotransferase